MRKALVSVALLSALPSLALAQTAPASPHTVTGNLSFVTDYRFRGISQTFEQPAIQGGFDYSHSSGFYLGTWGSNVTGSLAAGPSFNNGNVEIDFYGGYKWALGKDLTLDLGGLYYWYPGAKWAVATQDKYNNFELYVGLSYKWLSAKYSITTTDYFGTRTNTYANFCGVQADGVTAGTNCVGATPGGSKGSGYLDITGTFEIADKTNLIVHVGHQKVKNYGRLNYTDYKLGVTTEWVGFTWGASIIGTNADKDWWRAVKNTGGGNREIKNPGDTTLVLSVGKTF